MTAAEWRQMEWDNMLEKDLQHQHVVPLLNDGGWLWYHTYDSRRSPAGFLDFVALREHRCLAFELKREKEKPTPKQEKWLDAWRDIRGAEVYVWRPSDLPMIERILR
jgi:hypothetical protein